MGLLGILVAIHMDDDVNSHQYLLGLGVSMALGAVPVPVPLAGRVISADLATLAAPILECPDRVDDPPQQAHHRYSQHMKPAKPKIRARMATPRQSMGPGTKSSGGGGTEFSFRDGRSSSSISASGG
jgi:hypothetical protein